MQANSNRIGIWNLDRKSVLQLGMTPILASVLLVAGARANLANSLTGGVDSAAIAASPAVMAQSTTTAALTGNFVAAEAPTTGSAQIVVEDGHRYLILDSAFSTTDQAPDLHVLLDTAQTPPSTYSTFGSYINLGGLQQVNGTQRYPIPDSVDLANYKSVVIWCRMANATIGYAPLAGSLSAGIQ